jgi:Flp pilus assembly pilin Flp
MRRVLRCFVVEEAGQDLIEYAFLAAFIALAVTMGLGAVASGTNTQMHNISERVAGS